MSVLLKLDLRDNAPQSVQELLAQWEPHRVAQVISEPCRIFWRDRMASLGRNKRGWPSTHFWEQAARSVIAAVTADGLVLTCNKQGVRQRWKGGEIKPVGAGALTIPISPISYGHRASEFPGLFLMKTKKGAFLVQAQAIETSGRKTQKAFKEESAALGGNKKGKRLRAGLNFLFILSHGVNQLPDDRVVPTEDEFMEVAYAALLKGARN